MVHISYGILCIKTTKEYHNIIDKMLSSTTNIYPLGSICHYTKLDLFQQMKKYIQFLIISKKYSYSFFTILLGKYDPENLNYIKMLIDNLTKSELDLLINEDINKLIKRYIKNISEDQTNKSIDNFNKIKEILQSQESFYETPEWEIPKGKLQNNEGMIEGAIREFTEETSLKQDDFTVYKNIEPIIEIFKGTDDKSYMYVYYIALLNNNIDIHKTSTQEASIIKFMNLDECLDNIRINKRKKIIYSLYLYLISKSINNNTLLF